MLAKLHCNQKKQKIRAWEIQRRGGKFIEFVPFSLVHEEFHAVHCTVSKTVFRILGITFQGPNHIVYSEMLDNFHWSSNR